MIVDIQLSHFNSRTRELQYIDAVNVTDSKKGWLTFNISEALDHWMNNPDGNRGLYLSVHPADRSGKGRFIFSNFLLLLSKKIPQDIRYLKSQIEIFILNIHFITLFP